MDRIQVGNAPCSWGTLEFEGLETNPIGYTQMLDELVETGYTATELGDWGFMPTEPEVLRKEIESRNLVMLGAYIHVAFKYPASQASRREEVLKTARLLAAASPDHSTFLILADDNAADPVRAACAGRATPQVGLSASEWRTFARGVEEMAKIIKEETGVPSLFHHHCAGFVETPAEIDRLLENTTSDLINLVFDTGHYIFGAGVDGLGSDGNLEPVLERYRERIAYLHFKDCEPRVVDRSRNEGWQYLKSLGAGVFCELGKGMVDFKGVVSWLNKNNYKGWVLVEQDLLPGMGTPKESAQRNRDYLRSLGL